MNIFRDILSTVRSKMRPKIIIALALACVLIFPAIVIENAQIPTSDSNQFWLSIPFSSGSSYPINPANSSSSPEFYYLLDHKLNAAGNFSLRLNVSAVDRNLLTDQMYQTNLYFSRTTNGSGIFTMNSTIVMNHMAPVFRNKENAIINYFVMNYSVMDSKNQLLQCQKDSMFRFNNFPMVNAHTKSTGGNFHIAFLPSPKLGYYGLSSVFIAFGSANQSYNLSYHTYNPQNNNYVGPMVFLGNYSFNRLYALNSSEQALLAMNEAQNVTFFVNGTPIGTTFASSVSSNSFFSGFLSTGFGGLASELTLLVALIMVLMLFVPIFNASVYRYYLSMPRKRWYVIANEFYSSIIAMSMFEGVAFVATDILAYSILHDAISILAFIYLYLFSLAAFLVFASLYLLVGVYFIGKPTPKTMLTIFLVAVYPVISSLYSTLGLALTISFFGFNSDLYLPVLQSLRTYNVIEGLIPVLNVEELNSYFLRTPATGVIMLNHLSIFDLSPFIFVSSIVGISIATFYVSIKRYYRY